MLNQSEDDKKKALCGEALLWKIVNQKVPDGDLSNENSFSRYGGALCALARDAPRLQVEMSSADQYDNVHHSSCAIVAEELITVYREELYTILVSVKIGAGKFDDSSLNTQPLPIDPASQDSDCKLQML